MASLATRGSAAVASLPATGWFRLRLALDERRIVPLLLAAIVAFNLWQLWPEAHSYAPPLNDVTLHQLGVSQAAQAFLGHQDPTDPWMPTIDEGFPLFRFYQHLPYLIVGGVYALLTGFLKLNYDPTQLVQFSGYLLLAFFPLSVYWAMRRLGFGTLPAACAGLVAPLLSSGLYGFDYDSYVWRGFGLWTQLWGMVLLPPAVAQGYATLREGKGWLRAVILLAALLLSHLVLGYIGLLSIAAIAFTAGRDQMASRFKRLAALLALTILPTAYMVVPYLLDRAYVNRSIWEGAAKLDGSGAQSVLSQLARGQIFDAGRFPSLSLLAAVGALICLTHWRDERYRIPLVLGGLWLVLYFGRPTWGVLIKLLPFSQELAIHRLVSGVHLAAIPLMGIALAAPWPWLRRQGWAFVALGAAGAALLLLPVLRERAAYYAGNRQFMAATTTAIAAERPELTALILTLQQLPPGRLYAGRAGNWGKDYRVGELSMSTLLQNAGFDMLGWLLYHSEALNGDVQVWFNENLPEHYDIYNVKYAVFPADHPAPPFLQLIGTFGRHRLYQVPTSGYFELGDSSQSFTGNKASWYPAAASWLGSGEPAAKEFPTVIFGDALAESKSSPLAQAPASFAQFPGLAAANYGQIVEQAAGVGTYQAQLNDSRPATLVLKESYVPGWRAWLDGKQVATKMVMPSYVAIDVPAGSHEVSFQYDSGLPRHVLLIIGLLSLAALGLASRRWPALLPSTAAGAAAPSPRVASPWATDLLRRWSAGQNRVQSWLTGLRASGLAAELPFLAGVLGAALLVGLPLLQLKDWAGHDALEYLPRNIEFFRALTTGQPIPRWAPDLDGGYGLPYFIFVPPLVYALSSAWHLLGASFVASEALAALTLTFLSGLGMYCLAREFFGRYGGLVSAVAYLFAPYFAVNLYVRHNLMDFAAFAFLPFAFWGLYGFAVRGESRFLVVGALGCALLVLSSNPLALLSLPALLFLVAWLGFSQRSPGVALRGLAALATGLALSAFFWLPAFVERGQVHTANLLEGYLNFHNHFVGLPQLIWSPWAYGLSPNGFSVGLGVVHLGLIAAAVLSFKRIRAANPQAAFAVAGGLVLLLGASFIALRQSAFIWDKVSLLQYLEFPWRSLVLVAFGSALLAGFPLLFIPPQKRQAARLATAALSILIIAFGLGHAHPSGYLTATDAQYTPDAIRANVVPVDTAGEYEPASVQQRPVRPVPAAATVLSGDARGQLISQTPTSTELRLDAITPTTLRINTHFYPGWNLLVDGQSRAFEVTKPDGLMSLTLDPGTHSVVTKFEDTPLRAWSSRLSLLALLGLALAVAWRRVRVPEAVGYGCPAPASPTWAAERQLPAMLTTARHGLASVVRDRAVRQVVAIVLGLRVATGIFAWMMLQLYPPGNTVGSYVELIMPASSPFWAWLAPWQRYDALMYQHLATTGYTPGSFDALFLPLYPALVHVLGLFFAGQYGIAGLILSTVAFAVALLLLHRLIKADFNSSTADRTVLYLALAPAAFFFLAPYTEGLFLALAVGVFLAARRRRFFLAGLLVSLAVFCRLQGIVLLLPVLAELASGWWRGSHASKRLNPSVCLGLLLPLMSFAAFVIVFGRLSQDAGGYFAAQTKYIPRISALPWSTIADSLRVGLSGRHPEELLNLASLLACAAAVPLMLKRFPWSYTAFTVGMTLPLLFQEASFSPLMSVSRFALVVFPVFVLLAHAGHRQWVDRAVLATSPLLMGAFLFNYSHFSFVG